MQLLLVASSTTLNCTMDEVTVGRQHSNLRWGGAHLFLFVFSFVFSTFFCLQNTLRHPFSTDDGKKEGKNQIPMEFLQSKKTVAVLVTTLLGLSEEVVVGKGASLDFTISTAAGETTQQVHDARGVPPPPSMADDDLSCVDLAEAGTRECQKWAKIGEW